MSLSLITTCFAPNPLSDGPETTDQATARRKPNNRIWTIGFFTSFGLGASGAAIILLTPSEIRGTVSAVYLFVINMIAIGEESDSLEDMLSEIALHYDSELEYAMKKLSEAIGPLLTLGLAVVVGFFALAIYLPMWDMTKMAG